MSSTRSPDAAPPSPRMTSLPHPEPPARDARAEDNPAQGIGERLARLRAERGTKVSALAREIGVSPSLISQIERGQSRPSVSTLFAMARALDVPVDAFFRDAPENTVRPPQVHPAGAHRRTPPAGVPAGPRHRYLVRREERDVIEIEGGVRWESLTPQPLDELEFLELVYEPHAASGERLYRHPGTEIALVLSGRLDIDVGFEHYELRPGDSIRFPSSMPHRYSNPTDQTTRAVTVILHDDNPTPAGHRRS
jgi:transcriptional regulator with XRE-family HTH domain